MNVINIYDISAQMTDDHREYQVVWAWGQNNDRIKENGTSLDINRIVMDDETWLYYY